MSSPTSKRHRKKQELSSSMGFIPGRDMGLMKKTAICDFFKCLVPMLASALKCLSVKVQNIRVVER